MSEPPSDPSKSSWEQISSVLRGLSERLQAVLKRLRPLLVRLGQWWAKVLPQVRSRLPRSLNQNLSDRAITAIAISFLFVLLWFTTGLLVGKPSQARSSRVVVRPLAPAIAPTPPSLDLEPDPNRLVAIQEQVAAITDQYSDGLIQSVQANFRRSGLTVNLGDGWYSLSPSRQDSLAAELLQRAQKLGFSKLEMTDSTGTRLARNPVVGNVMIILQRTAEFSDGEPS